MKQTLLLCLALMGSTPLLFAQEKMTIIVNSAADVGGDATAGDGICADMNGNCSLRAAIDVANEATSSTDVVIVLPGRLPGGNTGTFNLGNPAPNMMENTFEDNNEFGDLDITGSFNSLTIRGTGRPGPKITMSINDRIFDVRTTSTVNFERLWISGGTAQPGENGTAMMPDGTDGADGGGMRIGQNATVFLDQVTFSGNSTQQGGNGTAPSTMIARTKGGNAGSGGNGGALYISTGATVDIKRSTFTQNSTGDGASPGSGQSSTSMPLDGGDGGDGGNGGAIYNAGTLTITSSTVWNNAGGDASAGAAGTMSGGETGMDGAEGEGGSGGGIANARNVGGSLTDEGTLTLINTIVAGNTAGSDVSNGTQPGADLFDASTGSTITLTGSNLIGTNDAVDALAASDLIGTIGSELDPVITGQNLNDQFAAPVAVLGSGSPAVDAGSDPGSNSPNFDGRGFTRPAGSGFDIGAYELDGEVPPVSLKLVEIDVTSSNSNEEFVEIKNTGDYPVQLDEYVLVSFDASGNSCFVSNLYGELQPGMLFTIGDEEVAYTVEQPLNFDVVGADNCQPDDSANQLTDGNGAVALYSGDGGNFTGITAGAEEEERQDVIVYNNATSSGSRPQARGIVMMDLCGAFGLSADCAATDEGDNSSIQVDENGDVSSGTPSPGAENTMASFPVELVAFNGLSPKAHGVELFWATAQESGNAGFSVQHFEHNEWKELSWVNGAGDSQQLNEYSLSLVSVAAGEQLFRLQQEDFDGTINISSVLPINVRGGEQAALFPTPTTGPLTVRMNEAAAGDYTITVLDASGRQISKQLHTLRSEGTLLSNLDLSGQPAAPYYVRIVGPGGVTTLATSKR